MLRGVRKTFIRESIILKDFETASIVRFLFANAGCAKTEGGMHFFVVCMNVHQAFLARTSGARKSLV